MNMSRIVSDRGVAMAALALVVYTLTLALAGPVISAIQTSHPISNTGAVKAIGVGVYWNSDATNAVTSIDWGTLEPGSNTTRTCYVQNDGNSALTLSMNTSNWDPSTAPNHISVSWDYYGLVLNPGDITRETFTLSISDSVEGITSFSFDITIVGSG